MATNPRAAQVRGRWEESRTPWYEQTAVYCDACGMLIPKRRYVVEVDGVRRKFCSIDCAQLDEKVRRLNKAKSAS